MTLTPAVCRVRDKNVSYTHLRDSGAVASRRWRYSMASGWRRLRGDVSILGDRDVFGGPMVRPARFAATTGLLGGNACILRGLLYLGGAA